MLVFSQRLVNLERDHSANDMLDIHIPKPDDQGAIIILNTERT